MTTGGRMGMGMEIGRGTWEYSLQSLRSFLGAFDRGLHTQLEKSAAATGEQTNCIRRTAFTEEDGRKQATPTKWNENL